MASKIAFNAVITLTNSLLNFHRCFGNLIDIVSGDLRQTLLIIKHGYSTQIMENTVKKSHLRKYFNQISLV